METTRTSVSVSGLGRLSLVGLAGLVGFVGLSILAVGAGLWKLLVVAWVAFAAMAVFAVPGARAARTRDAFSLVWGYGLAAGAMITSASVFLLPEAFALDPVVGGIGVAAGLLVGYIAHTVGHRLAHLDTSFDSTAAQITAHVLADGAIIGLIYATLPEPGLLLGLAIVSHKGPAGYGAARRLRQRGKPVSVLLLPAAGVGLAAIPIALVAPQSTAVVKAAIFGFSAGVFLHVAMDFLPECEVGGEVGEVAQLDGHAHELLDRLRIHAVASTAVGAVAVFVAWLVVA